jgi:transposase
MCGFAFEPRASAAACARCPLQRGCPLVRCPRCGYEAPAESHAVRWLKRLLGMGPEPTWER